MAAENLASFVLQLLVFLQEFSHIIEQRKRAVTAVVLCGANVIASGMLLYGLINGNGFVLEVNRFPCQPNNLTSPESVDNAQCDGNLNGCSFKKGK